MIMVDFVLCSRDSHFKRLSMLIMLEYLLKTNLAALRCTISILSILDFVNGDQTTEAYSKIGLTYVK